MLKSCIRIIYSWKLMMFQVIFLKRHSVFIQCGWKWKLKSNLSQCHDLNSAADAKSWQLLAYCICFKNFEIQIPYRCLMVFLQCWLYIEQILQQSPWFNSYKNIIYIKKLLNPFSHPSAVYLPILVNILHLFSWMSS